MVARRMTAEGRDEILARNLCLILPGEADQRADARWSIQCLRNHSEKGRKRCQRPHSSKGRISPSGTQRCRKGMLRYARGTETRRLCRSDPNGKADSFQTAKDHLIL